MPFYAFEFVSHCHFGFQCTHEIFGFILRFSFQTDYFEKHQKTIFKNYPQKLFLRTVSKSTSQIEPMVLFVNFLLKQFFVLQNKKKKQKKENKFNNQKIKNGFLFLKTRK